MRKVMTTLAVALCVSGAVALSAQAQTQAPGAADIKAQAQNATIIHKAACGGFGRHCPPGMRWVCNPGRCWCAPCY